ncbi:MAG: hypothetical protein EOM76_06885 [Sphingobacteriia bacterium]|nr:hypothetical protein [Sphingobacteriia bacterium]
MEKQGLRNWRLSMKSDYKKSRNIAFDDFPIRAQTANARKSIKRIYEKSVRRKAKYVIKELEAQSERD